MKRNFKMFLQFMLVFICVGIMPKVIQAEVSDVIILNDIAYKITSEEGKNTAQVIKSGGGYGGSIIIPEKINYKNIEYTVTSISNAFYGCTGLTSITLPESIISIGQNAFRDCTSLTSITLPESITSIGHAAFLGCTGLTNMTLPKGLTSVETTMFDGCTNLTSVILPEGITSIGHSAFTDCVNLKDINFPTTLTSIDEYAFWRCSSLTSITRGYYFYWQICIYELHWFNKYRFA